MRWSDGQPEVENCEVVIYYAKSQLYPISEWLHPGALPIGTGLKDDLRQDLPNLDWIIRHLGWMGFKKITVVSHEPFKGLDLFYESFINDLNIEFSNLHFSEVLKEKMKTTYTNLILVSGLIPSNSNLRNAFMLHQQRENTVSLLSIRGLQYRVGIAEVDGSNSITKFREKPIDTSLLINSDILIINTSQFDTGSPVIADLMELVDGHGYSIHEIIKLTTNFFVRLGMLKSVELTGISGGPWFVDLSQLENWVKLDHDQFISKFEHLLTK